MNRETSPAHDEPKPRWRVCDWCEGSGAVIGDDDYTESCPECDGKGGWWIHEREKEAQR